MIKAIYWILQAYQKWYYIPNNITKPKGKLKVTWDENVEEYWEKEPTD